jgi:S1-C subfamily serine protease
MNDNYEGTGDGEAEEPFAQIPPDQNEEPPTPATPPWFEPVPPTAPVGPSGPPTAPYSVPSAGLFAAAPGQGGGTPPGVGDAGPWQSAWAEPNPYWSPPRSEDPKDRKLASKAVALLIAAILLLAGGVGIGHGLWSNQGSTPASSSSPAGGSSPGSSQPSTGSGSTGSGAPTDVSSIASKVDPGLVDINTTLSYQGAQAAGTGMVLTSSGKVLTNNHVIAGATGISVTDVGNGRTYSATVVGYDITHDLAVLQLHGASGLQTVSIGNSSSISVGQSVVGIGNAGGTGGTPTSAGGSVTALNQSITATDGRGGTSEQLGGLIESNAAIQPGDSGGPLVNDSGLVIGIDTAASAGFEFQTNGSGAYSIPINGAITIAKQIQAGQASTTVHIGLTAFLGVEVEPPNGSGGFGGGFSQGGSQGTGVVVAAVVTGDPADGAGISAGDVITSISGTAVDSPSALTAYLATHHPGDKVQIGWTDQSGQSHTATVQLASGPPA